ncbi:ATP-dependent protease HslVU, peptidase subunit, partial [Vibrio parahaemolyticus V-223/04]
LLAVQRTPSPYLSALKANYKCTRVI